MQLNNSTTNILILDDLEGARAAAKERILAKSPDARIFEAESFPRATATLKEAEQDGADIDLLIADLTIGDKSYKNGLDHITKIHEHHPLLKILAISGKGTYGEEAIRAGAFAFFRKPNYSGLGSTVRFWRELEEMEKFFTGDAMDDSGARPNYLLRLAEKNSVGISVVDRRLRVLYLNRHQKEMSGIPSHEAPHLIKLCHELFAESGDPCPRCPVLQVFRTKKEVAPMLHIRGKKYYRITAFPLRKASGEVLAVIKVAVDVTDTEVFETFRRGLAGEGASLGKRIEMVLEAVASRGYRRPRLLLGTYDGRHIESYRMQKHRLDDFDGCLEPIGRSPALQEVLLSKLPAVYPLGENGSLPCWQETPPGEFFRPGTQFGLVPLLYDDDILGALYVDTHEPEPDSQDRDVIVSPTSLDSERLEKQLGKFAEEGAKAIVESNNMEMARQALKLSGMDHEVFLRQMDDDKLFTAVLLSSIQIIQDQLRNRIVPPREQPKILGHVMLKQGERLVRVTEVNKEYDEFGKAWDLTTDSPSLCVKAYQSGKIIHYDNLADSRDWKEFLAWITRESLAQPALIERLQSLRSYICLPLEDGNERIGTLSLQSPLPNIFSSQATEMVKSFVRRTGHAVRVNRAFQRLKTFPQTTMAMAIAKTIIAGTANNPLSIYALLTTLTHQDGFGFNRAIFLKTESTADGNTILRATNAIGPSSREEGEHLYNKFLVSPPPPLEDLLRADINFSTLPLGIDPLVIPALPLCTCKCRKEDQSLPAKLFDALQVREIIYLPILDDSTTIAAVLLDNFVTPKDVNDDKLKFLDAFANDYAMLLKNRIMVNVLQEEAFKKNELLHILAHQLRTDLTGPYQWIRRSQRNDKPLDKRQLDVVAEKLWTSSTAINDLLSFSVIESDRLLATAHFSPINIAKLTNETCQEVFVDDLTRYQYHDQISYTVDGDHGLLKQSLINLLDNARRYSVESSVIEVMVQAVPNELGWLAIEIRSTPRTSVDKSELEHIFEKFVRGACGKYASGTGLGLFIVDHAARLHKGHTTAKILEDGRIVFGLHLPYRHA